MYRKEKKGRRCQKGAVGGKEERDLKVKEKEEREKEKDKVVVTDWGLHGKGRDLMGNIPCVSLG